MCVIKMSVSSRGFIITAIGGEGVLEIISFLDRLRQAVEETFPGARSFVRPGFDGIDLNA